MLHRSPGHILRRLPVFIILLLFAQGSIYGQGKGNSHDDSLFTRYAASLTQQKKTAYYISSWREDIPAHVRVIRKLDDHTAIIRITDKKFFDSFNAAIRIVPANDTWKLATGFEKLVKNNGDKKYTLAGLDIDSLCLALQKIKGITILTVNRPANAVVITCKGKTDLLRLMELDEVIFLDKPATAHPEVNIIGYDRSFHGINAVDFNIPGATGRGIVAGVKEQRPDDNDIDLWKRVLLSPIADQEISSHATVIASIIGGAGNSSYYGRGIAWRCSFFPSSYANLFADDATVLSANKVAIQNHSYGTIIQQFYGAEAVSYDALAWNNKNYIAVFSAGNQGQSAAAEGKYANIPRYANLTGNFKMAKNVITVAAIDNKDIVAPLSSAGPIYDGRLAPQLTALGPNGTSDAAAVLSGTIAVMQQVYADSNSNTLPPASLVKAILYNTADDIYNTGIDYKTGYGLLNSYAAIKALQQKKYDGGTVSNGLQWTRNISVPVNTAELKVTLSWTDTAATVNNNKALVNDLDLEVIDLASAAVYKPWVMNLSANADSLARAPARKRDSLNTAEQVSIKLPAAGSYQVRVTGTAVTSSQVPFHISYKTDTLNTFSFTNPLHASDVNIEENPNLNIRWRAIIADTSQTGNLYISYDNGTSWQVIAPSVKLAPGKFSWPIKDTASAAVLKMETSFGAFLSGSFIVSKWTRIAVDFNCADSFRISWKKHVYATSYKVYALTDSPYLKNIITVTDTFAVFRSSSFPSRVYAVEPVLSNGIPAVRSQAINIDMQGVHCFYRTLNYNLRDSNNVDLTLELSVGGYADSISFERVTAGGGLLQSYGSIKANGNTLIYAQFVDGLPVGTTYFRARIRMKSGAVIYTDIIPVITSGANYISFYPNPANRLFPLRSVVRQGFLGDTRLSFYDVSGRMLLNFSYVPDQIDISRLQAGIVIFRLLDADNRVLQTGKVLIR